MLFRFACTNSRLLDMLQAPQTFWSVSYSLQNAWNECKNENVAEFRSEWGIQSGWNIHRIAPDLWCVSIEGPRCSLRDWCPASLMRMADRAFAGESGFRVLVYDTMCPTRPPSDFDLSPPPCPPLSVSAPIPVQTLTVYCGLPQWVAQCIFGEGCRDVSLEWGEMLQIAKKFQCDASVASNAEISNAEISGRLFTAMERLRDEIGFTQNWPKGLFIESTFERCRQDVCYR